MTDKSFIKRILKGARRRRQGLSDHRLVHPHRVWFTGISLAVCLFIFGTFWSLNLYWSYNNIKPENTSSVGSDITIYREDQVQQALEELKLRQDNYDQILTELKSSQTPSTPIIIIVENAPEEELSPEDQLNETEETDLPLPELAQ